MALPARNEQSKDEINVSMGDGRWAQAPSQDGSDESSRSSGGGRVTRFLDTTTKQLGAIAAVIGAIAALVVALKPSASTPQTSTAGSTPSATNTNANVSPGFEAFTLAQPKLTVRADASNRARATAQLPFHTTVWIACTRAGDSVTGAASITSTTWDEVRAGRSDPPVGFVPDAWVDTGTTDPTEHSC